MANRYWVGGTGSWNTSSTANWSTATGKSITASCATTTLTVTAGTVVVGDTVWSNNHTSLGTITANLGGGNWTVSIGGTFASQAMSAATVGASIPTTADSVFFDANSNSGTTAFTVTCGAVQMNDITVSNLDGVMTLAGGTGSWVCAGSLSFPATNLVRTTTLVMTFNATTTGKTITTNGVTLPSCTFNGVGGGWTLGSALTLDANRTLTLTAGTLNANNYNVTTGLFSSNNSNTRTITMGSGLWTLSGTGTVWTTATTTGLTFNKDTADILLSDTTTTARTFSGGSLTYNKLTIGGATGTSTTTISGTNTFSELASTKTVAHTITFSSNQTVTTWSITGTAGNVVTLQSSTNGTPRTLTKTGGGYLTGIDYLSVRSVIGSPVSDTWYIGANSTYVTTAPNQGYGLFTTQRASNAVVVLTSTASTTWTVPLDFNRSSNTIHLVGGGGGGGGSKSSGANAAGGGGGGGGGYTKLTNQSLALGASITYQAGAGGSGGSSIGGTDGTAGGTTSWDAGAATAGGGGGGMCNAASPSSTGGTAGTGTTFNGGVGGQGSTTTSSGSIGTGGGGGAGAAGLNGAGANGGNGFSAAASANIAGGGGGGADGGTAGGNASSATGGTGGNNFNGVGGGASDTDGAVGGGAGGAVTNNPVGGPGVQVFGVGFGGGAGGGDENGATQVGGSYGGGGGGGGCTVFGTTRQGANGRQGVIIITYVPAANANRGNFLMFM